MTNKQNRLTNYMVIVCLIIAIVMLTGLFVYKLDISKGLSILIIISSVAVLLNLNKNKLKAK